jgi:hypothetical protein
MAAPALHVGRLAMRLRVQEAEQALAAARLLEEAAGKLEPGLAATLPRALAAAGLDPDALVALPELRLRLRLRGAVDATRLGAAWGEALAEALTTYKGTVIFTSHDRFFMSRVATCIIEVREGHVTNYSGDYDTYVYQVNKEIEALRSAGGVGSSLQAEVHVSAAGDASAGAGEPEVKPPRLPLAAPSGSASGAAAAEVAGAVPRSTAYAAASMRAHGWHGVRRLS